MKHADGRTDMRYFDNSSLYNFLAFHLNNTVNLA
jgi:hypothetical protein